MVLAPVTPVKKAAQAVRAGNADDHENQANLDVLPKREGRTVKGVHHQLDGQIDDVPNEGV
jgi:hypothetical protein